MAFRSTLFLTPSLRLASRSIAVAPVRSYASPAISVTSTRSNASTPSLANIEAVWVDLPKEERYEVYKQLHDLQKKDWKELSNDEKKACEWAWAVGGIPGMGLGRGVVRPWRT